MLDSDPQLRRVLASLADRPTIDVGPLIAQVERLARTIPTVRLSARDMEDRRTELSVMRSRVVFIKFECVRERTFLADARRRMADHLHARYTNFMRKNNERQRTALVGNALRPFSQRIDPLNRCIELTELVLADYDARAFAFRDLVAALNLRDRGE